MASALGPESTAEVRDIAARITLAHPHGLPQIRLLELLWLAELKYYERVGRRLTRAGWWRGNHGPYSQDVINIVKRDTKTFRIERQLDEPWQAALVIHAIPRAVKESSDPERTRAVDEVLSTYREYTNEELVQEVYADPFFEATPFRADFDFTELNSYRRPVPESEARRLLELPTRPVAEVAELFTQ